MDKKNSTGIKKSLGERIFQVFAHVLVAVLALTCLYPFWYVLCASFSDANKLFLNTGLLFKPLGFCVDAYKMLLKEELLFSGYFNTFLLLATGVPLGVVMTALGAYFFSRKDVLYQNILFKFCLLTMYISGGMIPTYLNFNKLGMVGNYWGVIIGFCMTCYYMIILRTAFASVPESLCDAARIDGAGHMSTLFKVVLPLSKASIAVIAMYYGISIWNSWFWPTLLTRDTAMWPLQAVLRKYLIEDSSVDIGALGYGEVVRYAIVIISIIPILLVYPTLQKYFTKGVLVGAVKG